MSLFNELKRRKVFKVGLAYVLVAWLIAQVLQLVFESFGTPDWVIKTVLVLLAAGFPLALFLAWAFEMTPKGLKRDRDVHRSAPITAQTIEKLKDDRTSGTRLRSARTRSWRTSYAVNLAKKTETSAFPPPSPRYWTCST
ncbi:MAG: hypothetical protein P8X98_11210 [Woeseiaceae bacterium]